MAITSTVASLGVAAASVASSAASSAGVAAGCQALPILRCQAVAAPLPVTSRLPAGALRMAVSATGASTSRTMTRPLPTAPGKRARNVTACAAAVPSAVTSASAATAPVPSTRDTYRREPPSLKKARTAWAR